MKTSSNNTSTRNWTLVAIAIFFSGFLISCSEDEDDAVSPEARKAFIGSYDVKDQNNEESQYFHFTLQVKESTKGPDKVELKNFRYINSGVVGSIKGDKISISQTFQDSDENIQLTGEGTLTGDKLIYSYKLVVEKIGKPTRTFENTAEATRIP